MLRFIAFFILLFNLVNLSFAEQIIKEEDYVVLTTQNLTPTNKTQIVEFFSFGCPACFHLESTIETWVKRNEKNVTFMRIPVTFHPGWEIYAKAYYIAQSLNILPEAFNAIFTAIQEKQLDLANKDNMINFFT